MNLSLISFLLCTKQTSNFNHEKGYENLIGVHKPIENSLVS
jgi:hypothetical protein